jgi:hypothetical protein
MRDDEFRELLRKGMEDDEPSPEFLSSVLDQIDDEPAGTGAGPADEGDEAHEAAIVEVLPPPMNGEGAGPHAWVRRGLAVAAAVLVIVVLVIAGNQDDSSQVVTAGPAEESAPTESGAADLPQGIVQARDGQLVVGPAELQGLDEIWDPPGYLVERSAYETAGFQVGIGTRFNFDIPGLKGCGDFKPQEARNCEDGLRGDSWVHLFDDAEGAEAAVEVLAAHHQENSAGIFLNFPMDRTEELDLDLGDQTEAFVLTNRPNRFQAPIVIWRTGNVVHLVRDFQFVDAPGGVEAVVDTAEAIAERFPN